MDKELLAELERFKLIQNYMNSQELLGATHDRFDVPIWKKTTLTIREAPAYSNIGINKIDEMLRSPKCEFVLFVGTKKLVKREAFEKYLSHILEI